MLVLQLKALPDNWADPILPRAQAEALLATPHHYLLTTGQHTDKAYLFVQAMPGAQADILTLYVAPALRRQGLARLLLTGALQLARGNGCSGLTLEVDATNTAAIALYESHGLQQIGKRAAYYHNPVSQTQGDALVMAVSLA